ncbi:hypothetical protein ABW19_dt0202506 [Dactylella cylindrospora]|nr:hypothetical protein ABW19_dt0202506 [Dactylella cylindrospora]
MLSYWHQLPRKARIRGYTMIISLATFLSWIFLFLWALHVDGDQHSNLLSGAMAVTLAGFVLLMYCLVGAFSCPRRPLTQVREAVEMGRRRYLIWYLEEFGAETAFAILVLGMLVAMVVMVERDLERQGDDAER